MNTFWTIVLVLLALGAIFLAGLVAYRLYRNRLRTLDMVFLKILVPSKESKEDRERESEAFSTGKDFKEINGVMSHFFQSLHSIHGAKIEDKFRGQDFLSLEYVVIDGEINLFIVCPRGLEGLIEKQLTSFYPDSYIEVIEGYNIFHPGYKTGGYYMRLIKNSMIPFKTYQRLGSDPLNAIANVLSKFEGDDSGAIQIMIRPKKDGWQKKGRDTAEEIFNKKNKKGRSPLNPITWIAAFYDMLVQGDKMTEQGPGDTGRTTPATEEEVKAIEEKNSQSGYQTIIRIIASAKTKREVKNHLKNIKSAFSQYTSPNGNSFDYTRWHNDKKLIKDYIFRNFWRSAVCWVRQRKAVLSCEEIASLFHVPNIKYNRSPQIAWQRFKVAPAPANLPKEGVLIGHNYYRGEKKPVFLQNEDRFRHFYIIGQTGTGKSSTMQVMIRHDLRNGKGLCIVDPHGQLIEDVIPFIPRERADDVIYFNPSDLERPIGINLLEAETDEEDPAAEITEGAEENQQEEKPDPEE